MYSDAWCVMMKETLTLIQLRCFSYNCFLLGTRREEWNILMKDYIGTIFPYPLQPTSKVSIGFKNRMWILERRSPESPPRIASNTTNISRESSVGTISYMAPEAPLPSDCSLPSLGMTQGSEDSYRVEGL